MNFQYFLMAIFLTLILFLIALWINRTARIFIWNYFAGFSALISYLFIDTFTNFIDQHPEILKISNPDAVAGFLMNYKTVIIILLYFLFFILFYKSKLFEVEIEWTIKKIIWYLILPFLTVINLIFTMMLVINWPSLLTYNEYENFIKSLGITDPHILWFLNFLPWIVILVPIFMLILFINISIKITFPTIRKKVKKEQEIQTTTEHTQEE